MPWRGEQHYLVGDGDLAGDDLEGGSLALVQAVQADRLPLAGPGERLKLDQVPVLSAVTAVLSNLVSNVPAVLMLKPFVDALADHDTAWLVIAMASTLAGNFTALGSIANLIVVQRAAVSGVAIGFWDYFRVGAPLTIITLAIGTLWLWL